MRLGRKKIANMRSWAPLGFFFLWVDKACRFLIRNGTFWATAELDVKPTIYLCFQIDFVLHEESLIIVQLFMNYGDFFFLYIYKNPNRS
jgi:hypothetical protein